MDALAKIVENFHSQMISTKLPFIIVPVFIIIIYFFIMSLLKKKRKIVAVLAIALFLAIYTVLQAAESPRLIGREAPPFLVESGDGKVLQAKMLRGKVVVLFYESKDVLAKSRPLKAILNAYYNEQNKEDQQMILRVPIINCVSAAWPLKGIWKSRLMENSQRVGMTVYGDWDGKMGTAYGMKGDDTNLLIIDKKGVIRYFQSGVITGNGETAAILKKLLKDLVTENHAEKIIPKPS
jgi:alkyl hydroperoxide reductase subunit AhpC